MQIKKVTMKLFWLLITLTVSASSFGQVGGATKATAGKFDFNYYRDVRSYNVMTINLLADFTNGYQYFSLVDYFSELESPQSTDTNLFYTEQNIRRSLTQDGSLALSLQSAMQSGDNNDLVRGGLLINFAAIPALKFLKSNDINFAINLFPVQLDYQDGFNWQIEYFYSITIAPQFFSKRLYIAGFADQNMNKGKISWVTEHQLGYRFYDNFFAVSEYRINEFFEKKSGLGLGIEYLLPF
jgi:hypothetical protein